MGKDSDIGAEACGGLYRVTAEARAPHGRESQIWLGERGECRYCGRTDPADFRSRAHTLPEALGNKWIYSRDECDVCNRAFSAYESSLADGVSPLLTLGGVRGKGGRVRQLGRTAGDAVVRHSRPHGERRISVRLSGESAFLEFAETGTGELAFTFPVPGVPFRPRLAFKAVVKAALAVLPKDRVGEFSRLRSWLLDDGKLAPRSLEVGLSFASIGNAPPCVSCTVFELIDKQVSVPGTLFVATVGSVCLQIEMPSDAEWEADPPAVAVNLKPRNVVLDDNGAELHTFLFGEPIRFDWVSPDSQPQPIAGFRLVFDPRTRRGGFAPILRR